MGKMDDLKTTNYILETLFADGERMEGFIRCKNSSYSFVDVLFLFLIIFYKVTSIFYFVIYSI
jgi:hypothetical protein